MSSPLASPTKMKMPHSPSTCCPKCNKDLESGQDNALVVSFGDALWHVDCRCAKCNALVEGETNLLLLADGSPVCENCSYNCTLCRLPITTEAIVTGEESYHAECFKCRSCDNRIEELVFAKTSQGIYCMPCHNERVSRSRKHAEAKRNKSVKGKSSSSRSPNQSRSEHTSPSLSAGTGQNHYDFPEVSQPTSANGRSPLQQQLHITHPSPKAKQRALPPNPGDHGESEQANSSPPPPRNSFAPSISGSRSQSFSRGLTSSSSRPSLTADDAVKTSRSPSPLGHEAEATIQDVPPELPAKADQNQLSKSTRQFDSFPNLDKLSVGEADAGSVNKRSSLMPGSRPNKANNRRSGFYGMHGLPNPMAAQSPLEDSSMPETLDSDPNLAGRLHEGGGGSPVGLGVINAGGTAPPTPTKDNLSRPPRSDSVLASLALTNHLPPVDTKPENAEGHGGRSISFYDPDMLLDLPPSPEAAKQHTNDLPDEPPSERDHDSHTNESGPAGSEPTHGGPMETLALHSGTSDEESHFDGDEDHEDRDGIARKVRESLRQSLSQDGNTGSRLDISLVEKLLSELDETKDKMKQLHVHYSSMKRASSQYMAGISSAQDSYQREVELRRSSETEMAQLRTNLHEQAQKLVSLHAAQREGNDLVRRSTELRTSVFGIEKELSTLRAEREITIAEVEELRKVSQEGQDSQAIYSSVIEQLEAIKKEHRAALEELASQKEHVASEIADLQRKQDQIKEENALHERRSEELRDQNAQLEQQLNSNQIALEQTQKMQRAPSNKTHSKGSGSLPNSAASYDTIPENAGVAQARRVEHAQQQPVRKFKWGKGKPAADNKSSISNPTHKAAQGSINSSRVLNAPEAQIRQHNFQPTSILRPIRCEHCSEKMWGLQELRCASCGLYCHSKCQPHYLIQCNSAPLPVDDAEPIGIVFGGDLTRQAELEGKSVPNIVSSCISAVESYGMDFEGIYRKTGGMSQVKQITHLFEVSDSVSLDEGGFDVSAVTSVLKNYFRQLENPIFTFQLYDDFVSVAVTPSPDTVKLEGLEAVIAKMPETHLHVLSTLMHHLHRVQAMKDENKMTPSNLGVVFGPTLLRSSIPGKEFDDINFRARVVELCVEYAPRLFA